MRAYKQLVHGEYVVPNLNCYQSLISKKFDTSVNYLQNYISKQCYITFNTRISAENLFL